MTDSVTNAEVARLSVVFDLKGQKSKEDLKEQLGKSKEMPRTLRDFLYNKLEKPLPKRFVIRHIEKKHIVLGEFDKVTEALWKGRNAFFIRDKKGRFRTWFFD